MPTNDPGQPWIQGTEMSVPDDSFYVNDYPYVHPRQVDLVCLVTAGALVLGYLLAKKFLPRGWRSRLPTALRRWATPLAVVLFFVALETTLWITVQRLEVRQYRPDPVSLWRVRAPTVKSADGQIPTNSLGLAAQEVSLRKAPGTLRILTLGDSRTLGGAGAPTFMAYPSVLQQLLDRPAQRVEVIQGAVSGYSSYQGLLLYKNLGRRLRPDLVTVAFGYQDGMLDWTPDNRHMSDSYALTVVRGLLYKSNLFLVLRKNLLDLKRYRLNRERDTTPSFPRVSITDYQRNLTELIRLARQDSARVLLLELPHNPNFKVHHMPRDPAYPVALQQVAAAHGGAADVSYLDLRGLFSGKSFSLMFADDCHMTSTGHHLAARRLAAFIRNKVRPSRKKTK